jgi:hypothetical protein
MPKCSLTPRSTLIVGIIHEDLTMAEAERPISFPPAAIRSITAGRKTSFRSAVKLPAPGLDQAQAFCPFGGPGALLWVREPWNTNPALDEVEAGAALQIPSEFQILYQADLDGRADSSGPYQVWIPARAMPRWASRITLLIENTRLERLHDMGESDLLREGGMWREIETIQPFESEREGFARWWDSIHTRTDVHWNANPWVWAVGFKVLR